jgi:hypothetical protein
LSVFRYNLNEIPSKYMERNYKNRNVKCVPKKKYIRNLKVRRERQGERRERRGRRGCREGGEDVWRGRRGGREEMGGSGGGREWGV